MKLVSPLLVSLALLPGCGSADEGPVGQAVDELTVDDLAGLESCAVDSKIGSASCSGTNGVYSAYLVRALGSDGTKTSFEVKAASWTKTSVVLQGAWPVGFQSWDLAPGLATKGDVILRKPPTGVTWRVSSVSITGLRLY